MAQSHGYKRFLLSLNTNHHGTSTPRTSKILPRSSTPNVHSIPVISSKTTTIHKTQFHPHIYINRITLIQQQKSCHCKKRLSQNILGIF